MDWKQGVGDCEFIQANLTEIYDDLIANAKNIISIIEELDLPLLNPRVIEETDVGPGVGVSNY